MGDTMNPDDLALALRGLPALDLDRECARRIRDRAVARMEGRRQRDLRRLDLARAVYARFAEPVLAGALSLGFVAWAVERSVEVLRQVHGGFFWP